MTEQIMTVMTAKLREAAVWAELNMPAVQKSRAEQMTEVRMTEMTAKLREAAVWAELNRPPVTELRVTEMNAKLRETETGVRTKLNKLAVGQRIPHSSSAVIPNQLDSALLQLGLSRGMLSFQLKHFLCKS
jgi:hypothetical protein